MTDFKSIVKDLLSARHEAKALDLLNQSINQPEKIGTSFGALGRAYSHQPLDLKESELSDLQSVDQEIDWTLWSSSVFARTLLLVSANDQNQTLTELLKYSDQPEAIACYRSLVLLKQPEQYVDLAYEACRSNSAELFKAMAHGNPYPARYFDDRRFDQLLIKGLFIKVSLKPVVGLTQRLTDESRRVAQDYCAELKAAGREIPADMALILGPDF